MNGEIRNRALFFHFWFDEPDIAVDSLDGVSKVASVSRGSWVTNPAAGISPVEERYHLNFFNFGVDAVEETSSSEGARDEQAASVC